MKTPSYRVHLLRFGGTGLGLAFGLTGCVATADVTKAPFRATTHLSEATTDAAAVLTRGTTQATKDLTGPMKEMIAHMAPGADANVTDKLKVVAFAIMNFENLMGDIARGQGEYLESVATLLGFTGDRRVEFFQTVHNRYQWLFAYTLSPLDSLDRFLGTYYDPAWEDILPSTRS